MDAYQRRPTFRGAVKRDALSFRQIIGDALYGRFDSWLAEDEEGRVFRLKLRNFLVLAKPEYELLIYYSGHADFNSEGGFSLASVSWHRSLRPAARVDGVELIKWILDSPAKQISLVLDCCNSSHFIAEFSQLLAADRDLAARLLVQDKSIQVLVSGNEASAREHSRFTRKLLDGMRSGAAGGRKIKTNLQDLATYIRPTGDASPLAPTFCEAGVRRQHVIASNPNHGETLSHDIMIHLYDGDTAKQTYALTRLIRLWDTSPMQRARAGEVLRRFSDGEANHVPAIRSILEDWRKRESPPRRTPTIKRLILFRTRHSIVAKAAQSFVHVDLPAPFPFDLEQARNYSLNDLSLLEWIGRGHATLWILDRNSVKDLVDRDRDLLSVLETSPKAQRRQAIYWMEDCRDLAAYEVLRHAEHQSQYPEPVERLLAATIDQTAISTVMNDELLSYSSGTGVLRDRGLFNDIANENSAILTRQQKNKEISDHLNGPPNVREPKFLVYVQAGRFVLAICDVAASIDESELRMSFEPRAKARLATEQELSGLGFADRCVDPMFQDPLNRISRVYIDADIFFQNLMYPTSLVKVPDYTEGQKVTSDIPISSFVRTMQQVLGEQRVVFANIKRRKRKRDDWLHTVMDDLFVHTRFAPSPSNSLHLGSLRTALISYLFAQRDSKRGRFHIRFDDTNISTEFARRNAQRILADLRWVGLPISDKNRYFQTDRSPRANYSKVLELLARSGFCQDEIDGSITLKVNDRRQTICYWLDLKRGPQIRHVAPTVATNGKALDYSLTHGRDGSGAVASFKYKFAGAVDDLLHNSLVIRDIRQDHSFFTARQAAIMGVLREALVFPRDDRCRKLGEEIRKASRRRLANGSDLRPFPFPCPPAYLHVTRVANETGERLAKRSLAPEHSLTYIRENSIYFPETLIGWCLLTYGNLFLQKCGFISIEALIVELSKSGPEWFLPQIAQRLSFHDLVAIPQRDTVRVHSLKRLDRLLVRHLLPPRLNEFACTLIEQHDLEVPDSLSEFLIRLFVHREQFSGAAELAAITLASVKHHGKPAPPSLRSECIDTLLMRENATVSRLDSLPPAALKAARFHVLGTTSGPRISVVQNVLGKRIFSQRLRQGIEANG